MQQVLPDGGGGGGGNNSGIVEALRAMGIVADPVDVGLTYTQLELDVSRVLEGHSLNELLSSQPSSYTP